MLTWWVNRPSSAPVKTGDGQVTVEDVRALTRADAARIFKERYYLAPRIDLLPEPLLPSVFDMQVNAGNNAVRILQRLLAEFEEPVTVDGLIGAKQPKRRSVPIKRPGRIWSMPTPSHGAIITFVSPIANRLCASLPAPVPAPRAAGSSEQKSSWRSATG